MVSLVRSRPRGPVFPSRTAPKGPCLSSALLLSYPRATGEALDGKTGTGQCVCGVLRPHRFLKPVRSCSFKARNASSGPVETRHCLVCHAFPSSSNGAFIPLLGGVGVGSVSSRFTARSKRPRSIFRPAGVCCDPVSEPFSRKQPLNRGEQGYWRWMSSGWLVMTPSAPSSKRRLMLAGLSSVQMKVLKPWLWSEVMKALEAKYRFTLMAVASE
jgi:hypothetical protein